MSTVTKFSWTRLEGIGLIFTAFGITLLFQIPPVFFSFLLLQFDLNAYYLSIIGLVVGTSIILTTISCSLSEDLNPSESPSLQSIVNSSLVIGGAFVIGYFLFFMFLQPNLPLDLRELGTNQRFLAAYFLGLTLVTILLGYFYKIRPYFQQ